MYLLANLVSIIKNSINLKKEFADVPYSLLIQNCLTLLLNEGFILGFIKKNNKLFRVFLKYYKGKSVISEIKCVSLPGYRKYYTVDEVIKHYNSSFFLILSTSNGLISNFDLIFHKITNPSNSINNLSGKLSNRNVSNLNWLKEYDFNHIGEPINLKYSMKYFKKYDLSNIYFQKNIILSSFYRPTSIMHKLSKNQYLRNKTLKNYFKKYLLKNKQKFISFKSNTVKLFNNLYFFKFKQYFENSQYLNFKYSDSFKNYILKVKNKPLFSIFYFIFYIKQLNFSKYKYRFSLYIKYVNHLIKLENWKKEKIKVSSAKLVGGEPLLLVY